MSTVNMENSTVFSTATTPDFVWTHERILWTCICGGGSFLVLTAVVLYTFWKIQMSPKVQKKRDDERHEREKKNIALQVRESVHYNSRAIPKSTVGKIFSNEKRIKNEHMALTRLALEREIIRRSGKNPLSTQEIADKACDLAVDEVRAEGFLKYTAMAPIRINGYKKRNAYIVLQAPTEDNLNTFVEYVWTFNISRIIMLTPTVTYNTRHCYEYWPTSVKLPLNCGDIQIELVASVTRADWIKRTLSLRKEGFGSPRQIEQYQFKSSPDTCVDPSVLLSVRRYILKSKRTCNAPCGPVLVHGGHNFDMAGTYIAIEESLDRMEDTKSVQIFNFVLHLRKKNPRMVETLQSYQLIYQTVILHTLCDDTSLTRNKMDGLLKFLLLRCPDSGKSGFDVEFGLLNKLTPSLTTGDCAAGHRRENKMKNRQNYALPRDSCRPYLSTVVGYRENDYINAVYVNSFHREREFIVTQWPLENTKDDMWRMMYDCEVATLVLLDHITTRFASWQYPQFWPAAIGRKVSYGAFWVTLIGERRHMGVAERTLKIERKPRPGLKMDDLFQLVENEKQNQTIFGLLEKLKATESNNAMRTQIVRMFQLQSWPDKEKPSTESLESILYLNRLVELWQQNMALYRIDRPAVCVVSKDGAERCGVFCTLNQALDELGEEGTVDIFSAVRRVRNNRPELIKDTAEYRLCYKLVQHETRYQPSFDGNHNTSPLSPQTALALSQDEDFEHPV